MQDLPTKKRFKPVLMTLGIFAVTLVFTLIALILKDQGSPSLMANNIVILTLFNVNLIILIVLFLLLSRNLIKLFIERRHDAPGARFQTKLIAAFVGFSLIPTLLLAVVASGLLNRTIDTWFNLQIERSLNRSLDIAQIYYRETREHALFQAKGIAAELSARLTQGAVFSPALMKEQIRKIQRRDLAGIEVLDSEGKRIYRHLRSGYPMDSFPWMQLGIPPRGSAGERSTSVRSSAIGDVIIAATPILLPHENTSGGVLILYAVIPPELVAKMQEITRSFEEYHQLAALKNPIKRSYLYSFLAITLLILFSATWFGYYLARGITIPIQRLAEGTRAVAHGDLDFKIDIRASDELGVLVSAFNRMTQDLKFGHDAVAKAHQSLHDSNMALAREKNTMETVLENITTGVVSLDHAGHITTLNRSAEKILGLSRESLFGKSFHEIFHHVPLEVGKNLIKKIKEGQGTLKAEEFQFEHQNRFMTLRINMATLQNMAGEFQGTVIAFDDITELLEAQRTAAWQEVAQRLAHEIKNPLTPIQLCTQRLRKKHYERSPDYDKIFDDCTLTIIQEVDSLKSLLNEFSTFARMPSMQMAAISLHEVIGEVIRLYRGAHREIEIIENLGDTVPMILADREQIKRLCVNLFENAAEAMNHKGRLWVDTSWNPAKAKIQVTIADEGAGITPEDKSQLFIPHFSRKKSGTGLGLAIVHRIVSDHQGTIHVLDRQPKGSQFVIEIPVSTPPSESG